MHPGVFITTKKDGSVYYRSSITTKGKHISLGSFENENDAAASYLEAKRIYDDSSITILNFRPEIKHLSDDKIISLLNHRDNGIYIKTPIYLRSGYFSYFLKGMGELKFDNDDLFYYSSHRILIHDGHLYVNDYGMQYGILARYGIKNFAVAGKDYTFANGDELDYRYSNIIVINKYHGVTRIIKKDRPVYVAKIHLNGDYIVGKYKDDKKAAVAYNKAAKIAEDAGVNKNFIYNYVVEYTSEEYHQIYENIKLPEKYLKYLGMI